jgi:hypothetical protein
LDIYLEEDLKKNNMANKTLARKLRTKEELKKKVPIFQTQNWEKRKEARAYKVANKIKKAKLKRIK